MAASRDPQRPNPAEVVNFPEGGKLLKRGDTYYVCTRRFVYSKEKKRSVEERVYLGRIAGNVFYTMEEYKEKFLNRGLLKTAKAVPAARSMRAAEAASAKLPVRSFCAGTTAAILSAAAKLGIPEELTAAGCSTEEQEALLSLAVFRLLQPKLPWDFYAQWSRLRALPCGRELSLAEISALLEHLPVLPEELSARIKSAMLEQWAETGAAESLDDFLHRLAACSISVCSDGSAAAEGLLPADRELLTKLNWHSSLNALCAVCAKRD